MTIDKKTETELEAAVFRRLVEHLRQRSDVQNIDLMNLAGFCRNCLSNWYEDAAKQMNVTVNREDARKRVYGMPYDEWKSKYQREASTDQKRAFDAGHKH
jgi:uncharacterized protein